MQSKIFKNIQQLVIASILLAPMIVQASEKARIAIVGDLDQVNIGQDGYCGDRTYVNRESWRNIFVDGDREVWFRMNATARLPEFELKCAGEYSFTPKVETAYILRYTFGNEKCHFELFRIVPGSDPVQEPLTAQESQICLGK